MFYFFISKATEELLKSLLMSLYSDDTGLPKPHKKLSNKNLPSEQARDQHEAPPPLPPNHPPPLKYTGSFDSPHVPVEVSSRHYF